MANRLKCERSPYLPQPGDSPADWYSWCREAFQKAQQEDNLQILLKTADNTDI